MRIVLICLPFFPISFGVTDKENLCYTVLLILYYSVKTLLTTVDLNALHSAELKLEMFRLMKIYSMIIIIFNCWNTSRVPDLNPLVQVSLS